MKLLTWMHRKLRQNNGETLKEHPPGPSLLDIHPVFQKCNHGSGTLRQLPKSSTARNSYGGLEVAKLEDLEDEASVEYSDLFHGFLAIGTLGLETIITEPETPTFGFSIESIAEKETEVTEDELKLINEELEKVLLGEAKDDSWTDSSGRNSQVSNGRSSHASTITLGNGRNSHASTITLSGKPLETTESNVQGSIICPLEGYLFGSGVELPEKTTVVTKKEQRTSLAELFQKQKAEENSKIKAEQGEKRRDGEKTAVNLVKKILKKKVSHASSKSSPADNLASHEAAAAKLRKILHKFHKKVHPEVSKREKKLHNPEKIETNGRIPFLVGYTDAGRITPDGITAILHQDLTSLICKQHYKSNPNLPQFIVGGSDSNGSREHWVKTDADYLVLEL